jgi:hypothetical protein
MNVSSGDHGSKVPVGNQVTKQGLHCMLDYMNLYESRSTYRDFFRVQRFQSRKRGH